MGTGVSAKEVEHVPAGPVNGEDATGAGKIGGEHKVTHGIVCTSYIFYCCYISLVIKRDEPTNIGFYIMKVDIGRNGELIPQTKSDYEHHVKVYTNLFILTDIIYNVRYIIHMETYLQWKTLSLGLKLNLKQMIFYMMFLKLSSLCLLKEKTLFLIYSNFKSVYYNSEFCMKLLLFYSTFILTSSKKYEGVNLGIVQIESAIKS